MGTITDPAWSPLAITLSSDRRRRGGPGFVFDDGGPVSATPAALSATGDAFAVTYEHSNDATAGTAPVAATRQP